VKSQPWCGAWVARGFRLGVQLECEGTRIARGAEVCHWSISVRLWFGWIVLAVGWLIQWGPPYDAV
jgi:hypothetical protein